MGIFRVLRQISTIRTWDGFIGTPVVGGHSWSGDSKLTSKMNQSGEEVKSKIPILSMIFSGAQKNSPHERVQRSSYKADSRSLTGVCHSGRLLVDFGLRISDFGLKGRRVLKKRKWPAVLTGHRSLRPDGTRVPSGSVINGES